LVAKQDFLKESKLEVCLLNKTNSICTKCHIKIYNGELNINDLNKSYSTPGPKKVMKMSN